MIRRSYLRPGAPPKRKSWLQRSTKPIPQVNVEQTKRRRARNAKRMRSPEYKAAKAGAMKRAGGRCEFEARTTTGILRCPQTEHLQFHERSYARGRTLTSDDGQILCFAHHRRAERQKPHKAHRMGF
jgi:hypothetical protein